MVDAYRDQYSRGFTADVSSILDCIYLLCIQACYNKESCHEDFKRLVIYLDVIMRVNLLTTPAAIPLYSARSPNNTLAEQEREYRCTSRHDKRVSANNYSPGYRRDVADESSDGRRRNAEILFSGCEGVSAENDSPGGRHEVGDYRLKSIAAVAQEF